MEIEVNAEPIENVATSVLAAAVLPGKVPAPVLQLVSATVASQFPLVGVANHEAEAAWEECIPVTESPRPKARKRVRRS